MKQTSEPMESPMNLSDVIEPLAKFFQVFGR